MPRRLSLCHGAHSDGFAAIIASAPSRPLGHAERVRGSYSEIRPGASGNKGDCDGVSLFEVGGEGAALGLVLPATADASEYGAMMITYGAAALLLGLLGLFAVGGRTAYRDRAPVSATLAVAALVWFGWSAGLPSAGAFMKSIAVGSFAALLLVAEVRGGSRSVTLVAAALAVTWALLLAISPRRFVDAELAIVMLSGAAWLVLRGALPTVSSLVGVVLVAASPIALQLARAGLGTLGPSIGFGSSSGATGEAMSVIAMGATAAYALASAAGLWLVGHSAARHVSFGSRSLRDR